MPEGKQQVNTHIVASPELLLRPGVEPALTCLPLPYFGLTRWLIPSQQHCVSSWETSPWWPAGRSTSWKLLRDLKGRNGVSGDGMIP